MTAKKYFTLLYQKISDTYQYLNDLDAQTGDGDHGTTMMRGLSYSISADDCMRAKKFMRYAGGASGTLFGLLLYEIEQHFDNDIHITHGLQRGLDRICDLGQVDVGHKSMVDALYPAVQALQAGADLKTAVASAKVGRDNTRHLSAMRGRAQYVENKGQGHLDPGAVSVVIILQTLLDTQQGHSV